MNTFAKFSSQFYLVLFFSILGCQNTPTKSDIDPPKSKSSVSGVIRIEGEPSTTFRHVDPVELIDLLIRNRGKEIIAEFPEPDWISEDDVEKVIKQVESKKPCAQIICSISSVGGTRVDTNVGEIARMIIAQFAEYSSFPSLSPFLWSSSDAIKWWNSYKNQVGFKLHNTFVLRLYEPKRAGLYLTGCLIDDPEKLGYTKEMLPFPGQPQYEPIRWIEIKKHFVTKQRILELLDRADRPAEYLAVYVLLNELFPEHRLDIIAGPFETDVIGYGMVPVYDANEAVKNVSPEEFGAIVKTYWNEAFQEIYGQPQKNARVLPQ